MMPRHMKEWKPEHMRGTPMRRCHWCSSGPHRLSELLQILEAPMRFYFCKTQCLHTWKQHRHDRDVVEWLKLPGGDRAKILKRARDEAKTDACSLSPGVRGVGDDPLPL